MSSYGLEQVTVSISSELCSELRNQFGIFLVDSQGPTIMYGDNQSMVISPKTPSSTHNKKHNALAYHRVRKDMNVGSICFRFIRIEFNWTDILTEPLLHHKLHMLIRQILTRWKKQVQGKDKKEIEIEDEDEDEKE